jgi:UDP-N-acetyl-2-amino-2-deoxyglucuronate dehydrogenase
MTASARASRPWRVGLIGCGNVALSDHAPAYLALPDLFEVVTIADPTSDRRSIVGERLRIDPKDRHGSANELLARTDIDVVDICTPPSMHRMLIERASATGRHVICEKPLATTPMDADEIAATVASSGVTAGMIHNYLWFPEVVAACSLIAAGAIGEVQVVLIDSLGVDDNPGVPGYRPGWRHEPGAGGGVLMDLIHLVYLAEALLGTAIERVSATIDATESGAMVESIALCRFESASASALVNVGWGVGPGGLRVSGTNGRIEIRYRDGSTGPYAPIEVASVTLRDESPVPILIDDRRDTHRAALEDFGRALLEGRAPVADLRAGARAVSLAAAAYESAARGVTVPVPLDPTDPVFKAGVIGIVELDLPAWSAIRRRPLFGVGAP